MIPIEAAIGLWIGGGLVLAAAWRWRKGLGCGSFLLALFIGFPLFASGLIYFEPSNSLGPSDQSGSQESTQQSSQPSTGTPAEAASIAQNVIGAQTNYPALVSHLHCLYNGISHIHCDALITDSNGAAPSQIGSIDLTADGLGGWTIDGCSECQPASASGGPAQ